jgi:AraC family transcriptional regulator
MIETLERPATTVIGLAIRTKPLSPEIPALWPKFVARIPEIQGQTEPKVTYGVMWQDDSMDVLNYLAGVAVRDETPIPKGMTSMSLPPGTYAVFRYPLSGLGKGFGEIYNRLLPASDYSPIRAPSFERYDESFDPGNPGSLVQIGIPVRRRGK